MANKAYYVENKDLGLSDYVAGHEVIVVKQSKDKKRVKVKTITSLESPSKNNNKRRFKNTKNDLVKELYEGNIIMIPKSDLNTPRLSGVYTKGIWIDKKALKRSKYDTKISARYKRIIGK